MSGQTTLHRMRDAAAAEALRIEQTEDAFVQAGLRARPDDGRMAKRDDFDGVVRLIDKILMDPILLERLKS